MSYLNQTYFEQFRETTGDREAVLFLHGYPAESAIKNRDIAEGVHQATDFDVFLIHYPGLDRGLGRFTFKKSKQAVFEFCEHLRKLGYKTVHFVGHSWGGFLSLASNSFWSQKSKIVLLSPFLEIPQDEKLTQFTRTIYTDTKKHLLPMTEQEVRDDLLALYQQNSFASMQSIFQKSTSEIYFLQALHDEATPPETARLALQNCQNPLVIYQELETDHGFTDRQFIIDMVQNIFTSSSASSLFPKRPSS